MKWGMLCVASRCLRPHGVGLHRTPCPLLCSRGALAQRVAGAKRQTRRGGCTMRIKAAKRPGRPKKRDAERVRNRPVNTS